MGNMPELRFPEFASTGSAQVLADYVELQSGYAFSSHLFSSEGVKLVTPKNFTKKSTASFTQKNTKYTTESVDEKFICKSGDLLVLLTDLTPSCELLGKPMRLSETVLLNQRIVKIKTKRDKLSKGYLTQFLLTEKWHKRVKNTASGTTVRHSSNKIIKETKIYLPSVQEQQKIATFLSAVDKKLGHLRRKHELLESYKRGILQLLMVNDQLLMKNKDPLTINKLLPKLRFPEFSGDWRSVTMQSLIEDKLIIGHLDGNHGELYPRSEEFSLEGIPYISANDLDGRNVNLTNAKKLPKKRADKFKKGIAKTGDVLFAHNATVGPTALLEIDFDYVILSTTVTYYRCDLKKLNNRFLLASLNTQYFIKQYSRVMSQSTRNQVPITTQRKFYLNLPSLPEQQKIANFLTTLDKKIEAVQKQIDKTEIFKRGLLQKMFV